MKPTEDMSFLECYCELQDVWVPEEECNSVDFEVEYGRMTLLQIRSTLLERRITDNPVRAGEYS